MADSKSASFNVDLVTVYPEFFNSVHRHYAEGFIDFEIVYVFDIEAGIFKAFLVAGTGPSPIVDGSTPATPNDTKLASGLSPSLLAFSRDMTSIHVAPAFMGEEFPAVTWPSAL